MPSSQFVTANGIKLHYLDFGNASKPALVCIHGLSGNAHSFDGLGPHLSGAYHVLSIDVRGRGDSEWGPANDYNAPTYVSDLAAMLEALRIDRVTLVGTSMGGMISMAYAGGYPERVAKLVLNDVGPEVDQTGIKRITEYMTTAPAAFANLAAVAAYYRENYPALRNVAEPELLESVKWAVKPAPGGSLVWKMDPAVRNMPRTGSGARPMDMWVPFARITAPILVVRGAESDILARATTERMAKVARSTRVVEVPGVGHAPSLLEPEALAAIKEFLGC
jgi:pimeloyl-ACP methyl ester carboxylesterase